MLRELVFIFLIIGVLGQTQNPSRRPSTTPRSPSTTSRRPSPTSARPPPTTSHHPSSTSARPPPTTSHRPSSSSSRPPPTTSHRPLPTSSRPPPTTSHRPPSTSSTPPASSTRRPPPSTTRPPPTSSSSRPPPPPATTRPPPTSSSHRPPPPPPPFLPRRPPQSFLPHFPFRFPPFHFPSHYSHHPHHHYRYRRSTESDEWWRDTFIYQIYPRSFKDSNGDGVGDLNGITSKLDHLVDLGISALWLSPIFTSPMADFGYDISNFTDVDPIFGTLDDLTTLTARAHAQGLKVILDFVPNHSSDQHPWFNKSIQRIAPYDDYYIWKDAKIVNGTRQPPNNWLSVFFGSAWEWNEQRQQYYLHQFGTYQPDLNFRNPAVRKEMADALIFWADRGVDGFRIDSVLYMYEDAEFRDEPVINSTLPQDDPKRLEHIYTIDQIETYEHLRSWRELLDAQGGEKKILLTEAYTSLALTEQYYEYGSDVPFNFMFVTGLNNQSKAIDFKRSIDQWIDNIPEGGDYTPNWVLDNHDNRRTSDRFGIQRADQIGMLASILPGIGIIYNGDEIGMEDAVLSWEETVDPQGLNAGPERYAEYSRDPERTPFQWDNSTSAGFSTSNSTWLPVNSNYKTLNLAAEKADPYSHYSIFKKLIAAKKLPIIRNGSSEVILATENVLSVVRRWPESDPFVLLINFLDTPVTIDASAWLNIPETLSVYAASVGSNIKYDATLDTTSLTLPGAASVILY